MPATHTQNLAAGNFADMAKNRCCDMSLQMQTPTFFVAATYKSCFLPFVDEHPTANVGNSKVKFHTGFST